MELICSGNSQNLTGYMEHSHPVYEIVIVTKGICQTKINHTTYEMKRHSVLLTPPNFSHSNHSDATYSDLFIQVDSVSFPLQTPTLINDYSGNILRIMQTINQLEIQHAYSPINDLLNVLFQLIQSILGTTYKNPGSLSLKTLIEKNVGNAEFSVAETARTLGYNYDYMRRIYKADMGITPTEYLLSLRLQQAEKLLKNTNFQINTIALQCGFSDPYYFSRLFKQKIGISPKDYRKKLQNQL